MSRSLRVLLAAALCAALLVTLAPLALAASGPPPGWTRIATGGLGNPADAAMFGFVNFKGRQYCFVPEMGDPQTAPPAPVLTWDGTSFAKAAADGFGDSHNTSVMPGCEFQGEFYFGTENVVTGAQMWRSPDGSHWEQVGLAAVMMPGDYNCQVLGAQGGKLLLDIDNQNGNGSRAYSYDGSSFTPASTPGYGMGGQSVSTSVVFQGRIHMVVSRQDQQGPLAVVPVAYAGGTTWAPTAPAGFGDVNNNGSHLLFSDGVNIYGGTDNVNGGQVWRFDGTGWKKVNIGGIENPANNFVLASVLRGRLVVTASFMSQGPPSAAAKMYMQRADGGFDTISENGFGDPGNVIMVVGPPINGKVMAGTFNFSGFQAFATSVGPTIESMDPTQGPYGTKVTIAGRDFGAGAAGSYVTFNGGVVSVADATSWTDTRIEARVPEGANAGPVKVVTSEGESNEVSFTPTLSKTYYFAEGSTRDNTTDGTFDEYLCMMNPGSGATDVGVTYMTASGTQMFKVYTIGGQKRLTVNVADEVGRGQDVACALSADTPIVAERSMYFDYHDQWNGGSTVVGAPNPGEHWYFAEGTTRDNPRDGSFDEWLCLMNPNNREATATISYMTGGAPVVVKATIPPLGRITRDVASDAGREKDVSISVAGDLPVVAERPEYFDYHNKWAGGDTTVGTMDTARDFYFAEGFTYQWANEWVCIANPGKTDAHVNVVYQVSGGSHAENTVVVSAGTRYTLDVASVIGLDKDVSIELHSDVAIAAERSQYFDYGQGWAGGAFGTGAPAPRKTFYFAEGTTRSNSTDGSFDEWISIQNPNSSTASITLTFVKPDGINIVQKVKVTPGTRSTVSVNQVLGPDMDASLILTSSVPVLAERPMYFSYKGFAQGGSDTRGYGL